MVLALCEMQTASSRIWIRFAESISYDNNDYTKSPSASPTVSFFLCLSVCLSLYIYIVTWICKRNRKSISKEVYMN